jgi:DNA polymerase III epsilon subunit-like protein
MQARAFLEAVEHYCILDTETTGLDAAAGDQVVEVAVLGIDGVPLLDTLVRPNCSIPPQATTIHGISDADVADAPSFAAVLPQLAAVVAGRTVLIYNACFDLEMISEECVRLGQSCPLSWEHSRCMMRLYSDYVGLWSEYWHDYQWVPLNGGHRALGDCRAVLQVLEEMARIPLPPFPALAPGALAASTNEDDELPF